MLVLSKHTELKAGNLSEVQANYRHAFENKWLERTLSGNLQKHPQKRWKYLGDRKPEYLQGAAGQRDGDMLGGGRDNLCLK